MTNGEHRNIRLDDVHDTIRRTSNIEPLIKLINDAREAVAKVNGYKMEFYPEEIQNKASELDKWEHANQDKVILQVKLKEWQNLWKTAYQEQLPKHLITPIHKGLTPLQSICLGLLAANIRTIPMMVNTLEQRSRNTIQSALKGLVSKGYIFKASASMYFEKHWSKEDAKAWAKNYIVSNRNANGVVPMVNNYGFDKVAATFTRVMRKNDNWKRVLKHPDEHTEYKEPWKLRFSAADRLSQ